MHKSVCSRVADVDAVCAFPQVAPGEYVPDGMTRAQWAQIKAADAAKKAARKERKDFETLEEWQVRGGACACDVAATVLARDVMPACLPLCLLTILWLTLDVCCAPQFEFENGKTGHRFAKTKFDVSNHSQGRLSILPIM
jgi:hypothetical protein